MHFLNSADQKRKRPDNTVAKLCHGNDYGSGPYNYKQSFVVLDTNFVSDKVLDTQMF